jgi:outer membrane protein OmpA-like peptidoglycan-associated protein
VRYVTTSAFLLAATVCAFGQAASDKPAAPNPSAPQAQAPAAQQQPAAGPEAVRQALLDLRTDLNASFQENKHKSLQAVEAYLNAMARIEVTHQHMLANFPQGPEGATDAGWGAPLARKSKERKTRDLFAACSLLTEIAFAQMERDEVEAELLLVTAKRDTVKDALGGIYENLLAYERGRASELKSKLDAENARNRALADEMEKRFKELQGKLINVYRDARGTIISMSDILFGFDKADITPDLKTSLAKIAGILTVYRDCKVIVEGHTDNVGAPEYNKGLSERRANNVKAFLIEQGVTADRLSAAGYGEKRPVASNSTSAGRQKNRRVDLVIPDRK